MPSNSKNSSNKKPGLTSSQSSSRGRSLSYNQKKISNNSSSSLDTKVIRRHINSETLEQKPDYMQQILRKNDIKGSFTCTICDKDGEHTAFIESAETHIKSKMYERNTSAEDKEKLKELITQLEDSKSKKKLKEEKAEEKKELLDVKSYLEFIAFGVKEHLSFSQLSNLGKFLKGFLKRDTAKIFQDFNFDREEISKVTQICFGEFLLKDLQSKLETNKYSFTIDFSTLCGENICALTVKYLESVQQINKQFSTEINHKILAIQTLEDSSTAAIFKDIVENKLFINPKIKENFVGISHDHAASLAGVHSGLTALMKNDLGRYFFDLADPCHSLNLTVSNSLKKLPKIFIKFIDKINQHFSSPQRKAVLNKIQEQNSYNILAVSPYIKTRWLSLENSLSRLLNIWESTGFLTIS